MAGYLIEFRVRGYAKRYAKSLIYELGKRFKVRGMTHKNPVPHITLYGPFTTNNEGKMVSEIENVCKKSPKIYFSFRGFNYFNNSANKVIYLDICPSEELKKFRYDLASNLKDITSTISKEDKKDKENFKFHSTLAFKDIDNKFGYIWKHINTKKKPNIRQTLLRVTILKNGKILYEYDFLQRRLLNRRRALDKRTFRETIKRLKQKEIKTDNLPNKSQGKTIFEKIKSFLWMRTK